MVQSPHVNGRERRVLVRWSLILLLICVPAPAVGDDPADVTLEDLREVESLRKSETLLEAPLAVSVVEREEITRAKPGVDLEEALELVPGVFPQSSRNFAQDTRVSIRGRSVAPGYPPLGRPMVRRFPR